jgi:elongation factor 2 kinase
MCKYYQVGRFSELGSEEFDEISAFYHLEQAAELSVREAIFSLAKIYLDLPRDLLPNYHPTNQTDQLNKGVNLMIRASELQETEANLYLAQIYDKGIVEQDWNQAAKYYEKYIHIRENESNNLDEDSGTNEPDQVNSINNAIPFHDQHDIVARLATLYKTGGYNLSCNYQKSGDLFNKAAEMATAAMKGRLANKYYQSAEEAYALESDE